MPNVFVGHASGDTLPAADWQTNFTLAETSFADHGAYIVSGLVPSAGSGLSVNVTAGHAIIGADINFAAGFVIGSLTDATTNHLYVLQNGTGTANTTGTAPANSAKIGTCVTAGGVVTSVGVGRTSGRQQFRQPQDLIPGGAASGATSAGHPASVSLASWAASAAEGVAVYGTLPVGATGGQIQSGTVAARPAAGNAGAEYLPTDGIYVYRDTGALWAPWGPVWPLTEPISGNFAWINQGSATIDTTRGGVFLFAPANGATNMRIRKMAAPATPYTVTMAMLPSWAPDAGTFPLMGIVLRESSTSKLVTLAYNLSTTPRLTPQKWTSPTVFSVAYTPLWDGIGNMQTGPLVWLRVTDDGANLLFSASNDGRQYYQQYSVSRTDFLAGGPNEVGFFCNSNQATWDVSMWVVHFALS